MIDTNVGGFVETSLLGCFQVADIEDVGYRILISGWASKLLLINLVIEEEELLPVLVVDPSLMGVGSSLVLERLNVSSVLRSI